MLKFWKAKCCKEVIGNPITTMFLYLTFRYVYFVVLAQHILPVISITAVWKIVHLGTRLYGYMLLAFKKVYVNISRKIQKQYGANKNHVSFIMVPFLVYINQFLPFLISVSSKVVTSKTLFLQKI